MYSLDPLTAASDPLRLIAIRLDKANIHSRYRWPVVAWLVLETLRTRAELRRVKAENEVLWKRLTQETK